MIILGFTSRDGSGQIDQFELQTALTQSGMNGNWKPFSPETCRLMIAMLDRDQNGTLNFEEFKNLWNIINGWKQVFMQADRGMCTTCEHKQIDFASYVSTLFPKAPAAPWQLTTPVGWRCQVPLL
jgi:hypothetical protein